MSIDLPLDDNLTTRDFLVVCRHCETVIGTNGPTGAYLSNATIRERTTDVLGPATIRSTPDHFIDQEVKVRQSFCPGCKTLLSTEVVLADEQFARVRRLTDPDQEGTP
jgi:hypothetical protein